MSATTCRARRSASVFGGGFDGFGYVVGDERAGIEYAVPTITKGFFEYEMTGMRTAFNDEKYKLFAMYDGDWSSGNLYRATIEQRLPPRHARFKFLTGDGCDSKCGTERRYIEERHGDPVEPGRHLPGPRRVGRRPRRLHVTSLERRRPVGPRPGLRQRRLGGIYNPANHRIAIGNPRAGGGEHGSFPGHAHPQRADRRAVADGLVPDGRASLAAARRPAASRARPPCPGEALASAW